MDRHTAGLRVEVGSPDRLMPGVPARLGLRIEEAASGDPVQDIVESHERPLHFIVVSTDLEFLRHLHPWPVADELYWVDVTFPSEGRYYFFLEFLRAGGENVIARETFVFRQDLAPEPRLHGRTVATFEDLKVSLHSPARVIAGLEAAFALRVEDDDSGLGITSLTPYLAAAAHVVVIDSHARSFGHARGSAGGFVGDGARGHSALGHGSHARPAPPRFGPDIQFAHVFPTAGAYRLWVQFGKPDRSVATASFDLDVT